MIDDPREYNITRVSLRVFGGGKIYFENDVPALGEIKINVPSPGTYIISLRVETLLGEYEVSEIVNLYITQESPQYSDLTTEETIRPYAQISDVLLQVMIITLIIACSTITVLLLITLKRRS